MKVIFAQRCNVGGVMGRLSIEHNVENVPRVGEFVYALPCIGPVIEVMWQFAEKDRERHIVEVTLHEHLSGYHAVDHLLEGSEFDEGDHWYRDIDDTASD